MLKVSIVAICNIKISVAMKIKYIVVIVNRKFNIISLNMKHDKITVLDFFFRL